MNDDTRRDLEKAVERLEDVVGADVRDLATPELYMVALSSQDEERSALAFEEYKRRESERADRFERLEDADADRDVDAGGEC